ncbi:MAG: hypothetical protein ACOX66_02540 [Oscillospiraceae bacterium]|jgi:hypothetical protein
MLDISTISKLSASQSKLQLSNQRFKAYAQKQRQDEAKSSEKQGILEQLQKQQQETERKRKLEALDARLKNGENLSPDEIAYLQRESPGLYEDRMKERREQEAYKKALENAKTKAEVNHLHMSRLSQFISEARTVANNPVISDGKKREIIERIQRRFEQTEKATIRFRKSEKYRKLPADEREKAAGKAKDEPHPEKEPVGRAGSTFKKADTANRTDTAADTKPSNGGNKATANGTDKRSETSSRRNVQTSDALLSPVPAQTHPEAENNSHKKDAEELTAQLLELIRRAKTGKTVSPGKINRLA